MGSDQLFHNNKMRKAENLRRKRAAKAPYQTVLIVCEGETEYSYFKDLRKFHRLNIANIEILSGKKGSAPISVVDFAIEHAEKTPDIDIVYCIFDRDDHQSYLKALNKIKN